MQALLQKTSNILAWYGSILFYLHFWLYIGPPRIPVANEGLVREFATKHVISSGRSRLHPMRVPHPKYPRKIIHVFFCHLSIHSGKLTLPLLENGPGLSRCISHWKWGTFHCYGWWKKSCTSWHGKYPIIYKVLYIPGGYVLQVGGLEP